MALLSPTPKDWFAFGFIWKFPEVKIIKGQFDFVSVKKKVKKEKSYDLKK